MFVSEVIGMKMYNDIASNQKIVQTEELKNLGYSYYKITKMVEAGEIRKLNRKNYENLKFDGEDSDFYYVRAYIPKGVVCLMSAAVWYELSVYRPTAIDVSVHRDGYVMSLPEWPIFNIYYFQEERFKEGVEIVSDGVNQFRIYDIEKTVIDITYYRNKIGIEEMKEIITNYLKRGDRNLNKLYRYADKLKVRDILNKYMEVLV